ncbi:T9SS type B sorting domain-containing protein [Aequorivita sp. Q41]|uniref:T9SS type B sorting domain-containing protein n=1 Tax=Aequorivita sp. Q41 TaxID=3153300 RepID=UPI003242B264
MKKLILLLLFTLPYFVFSQNIDTFKQFNGRYDFTAVGNTLNTGENNQGSCDMLLQSSATLNLGPGTTLVSAHLYWASIGTGDFDVNVNGTPVSAERTFAHTFNGDPYFGAYAEVTNIVAATGNGTYTFSDMDVQALLPQYCGTNFGGWAIYVIYEDPSLLLNQISLFDGLESVNNVNFPLSINLGNLDVTSDQLSKIGFLAWEGDETLANQESLRINGTLIDNPPLNPSTNAFNSTNSYTNSAVSYQMDLDYYDLVGIVQPGDTNILIELTSGQDYIMVHNIITSVNSELPDATIEIDNLGVLCQNGNIDVDYTAYNVNSTNELPGNTPIAFYLDDGVNPPALLGQTNTINLIPIGGSESGTITLAIPLATPNNFDLIAVIDDIGNGTGVVAETDESNNEFTFAVDLSTAGILLDPGPACLGSPVILDSGVTDPPFNIQWFRNTVPIPGANGSTYAVTTNGIYTVEAVDGLCRVESNPVVITFRPQPVANPNGEDLDLHQCDFGTTTGVFNLTDNDADILGGQNPADFDILYYETLQAAMDGVPGTEILGGVHFIVPPSPQTIYARIQDSASGTCFDIVDFKIYFSRAISGIVNDRSFCDYDQDGGERIDLEAEFNPEVLDGQPASDYNITYHSSQADADAGAGALAIPYFVNAPSETLYIRLENRDNPTVCFDTNETVTITIDSPPTINTTPPNLILCDDNNDGFATFDLSLQDNEITLGDPNLQVSYHGTLLDAENGALPLPNFYINDRRYLDFPDTDPLSPGYGTGGVWARVRSTTSSCVSVVPFTLEVRFSPVGTTPEPLRLCDDAVADGITRFDLTVVEAEVLGALDPTGFDLYYYENFSQAVAAGDLAITPTPDFSQAIADPTNFFNNTNPQIIYILIVSNTTGTIPPNPNSAEGCYDIVELELHVDPLPLDYGPFSYELCDDDLQGSTLTDEISTFNLTSIDPDVTNNDNSLTVEWFLNLADEAADTPIPNPTTFQNTVTPQTVIGRVTSGRGCETLVTLTLTVLPNPNPNMTPTPLELCDDDDDGLVGGWDLTLADTDITANEADVSVRYFRTRAQAVAGLPATVITMPFTNTVPFIQTVYARVEKDVPPASLGCYTIVELELHVIALPDKPQMPPFTDPFIGCDETNSGTALFDLTRQNVGVIGTQNAADFLPILYYDTDLATAQAGVPGTEIGNPTAYVSAGGVPIWVRLESIITGCVRITEFQLAIELFPTIGVGNDLSECDDLLSGSDTDGLATFDLTVNDDLISLGDPNLDVFYYASPGDQAANNPIANPSAYQNTTATQQRIFVTAFSQNGCRATNSFLITVEPTPDAFSPGVMVACDSDYDGFADFDLTSQDDFITNSDANLTVSYHTTLLNAQNDDSPITTLYENDVPYNDVPITDPLAPDYGTGGVWARVTTTVNSCHRIISFALEVHASPIASEPEPLRACDFDGDGVEIFDLTDAEADVLGSLDPTQYDVYYYENLIDAQTAGDLALLAPDFSAAIAAPGAYPNTANPQTLFVLVVGNAQSSIPPNPNGAEGCYDIVELQLFVDPVPINNGPFTNSLCDDDLQGSTLTDGISTFDLTLNDFLITGGAPGLTVTWFEASGTPILNPETYQNIATPQTVIGTITSEFGCANDVTVTLNVLPNPNPKMDPDPIEFCDEGVIDDGIVNFFDLTVRDAEIINGQNDVSVLYYETEQEAIDGVPGTEILGLYTNTTPFNQIIYARVTNDVPPKQLPCYTIVELELIVVPLPDRVDPTTFEDPIFVCDEDGNGMAIFDLTTQNTSVYNGQNPADFEPITYHISLADAEAGTPFITTPDAFESGSRTIWVRLASIATGCARITPFEIIAGVFPGSGTANDLILCDDEVNGSTSDDGISTFDLTENTPLITNGDPTLTVLYYASQFDQDNDIRIANPTAYQNVDTPQQEIFVTILGQNTCRTTLSFMIIVNPIPEPVAPTPLFACDMDNNGIAFFDLESKSDEIRGGDPTLIITYHETMFDARTGDAALTSPYENIFLNNQTIYVRAAYDAPPAGSGCYTIVTLELIVNPTPLVPNDLPDLVACDDSGFYEFDLTVQEELIYGTQTPTDYTLRYYLNEADAIAGGNGFIVQPEVYTNTGSPQTIWVRLTDNLTECYKVASFNLVVNSGLLIVDPTPLVLCDDLGEDFDGKTSFNLTDKNGEITNGVVTQGVSYFLTEEDAQDNINRIDPDTAYVNEDANGNPINPQLLYVRVEDSNSKCISFTTLIIRVVPNPNPVDPEPIELCDLNEIVPPGPYDEVEIFDLTIRETQILNGNNWTIGYYENYDDAINENDEIVAPEVTAYQNTSNPQIIYVRTTNPTSLCFEIVELELIVNPLPDDSAIVTPYIGCSLDGSEIGVFNLETKVDEILGGQTQPPFEVTFYIDMLDAENGINAIVNTTSYQNKDGNNNPINPQLIYTGIRNTETGCYIGGVQSFELIVQDGATANSPSEPFIICDNLPPSDGYGEFDFDDVTNQQVSDLRAEILGGQDPAIFEITFHETEDEAAAGIEAITFPYVNIINPQRIYIRVTNNDNLLEPKCYGIAEMVIKVEQIEDVTFDGDYRLCVDENGNPIQEVEGSPSPPIIDSGLDPTLYTFQWDLDGVILVGENGPSIIALQGGVYTLTYTELASNCENVVSATVTVSSPPFVYEANLINGAFAGNHIIEVIAEGEGTYEYQLDDGPFQDSNIFENVEPGNHTVTIKDKFGCGEVTFDVGVIDYPPYFTPNSDGYHDTWNIIGIAAGDPTAKIYIFDRFGKLLKQLSPLDTGWDGTYNGNPLPSSDYWFRVEYTEDEVAKEFKGHFTLKR